MTEQNTPAVPNVLSSPAAAKPASLGWLGALLIIAAVLAVYLPALPTGFIWDDDQYLALPNSMNPARHSIAPDSNDQKWATDQLKQYWTTTATPQYYPLVFSSYWLENRLWGFNPKGYHIVNIVLHALTAVLVWRVLLRIKVPGAWLIAMVFALHPVQVETVSWVTERKNTLSGLFYMLALLCYLKFYGGKNWAWYLLSFLAFLLAMFSKTVAASLPVAILLLVWLARERFSMVRLAGLVPFFAVGLCMGHLTAWYEFHKEKTEYSRPMPIEQAVKLSRQEPRSEWQSRSGYDLSMGQRGIIASRSLLHYTKQLLLPWPSPLPQSGAEDGGILSYVKKTVTPKPLSFFYHRWDEKAELKADEAINFWPVLAVIVVAVATFATGAIYGRAVVVGVGFFVLTIFPALGFVDTYPMRYSFVADHFQYLAGLGLIALIIGAIAHSLRGRRAGVLSVAASLVLIVAMGAMSHVRVRAFNDEETLWKDTIAKTPTAWAARINLGSYYGREGSKLLNESREANRRGDAAQAKQKADDGQRYLGLASEQMEEVVKGNPRFTNAYENLANVRAMQGRFAEAESLYRETLKLTLHPTSSLYARLGKTLLAQNKFKAAENNFDKALQLDPQNSTLAAARQYASQKALQQPETGPATRQASGQPATRRATTRPGTPSIGDVNDARTPQERVAAFLKQINEAMRIRDYARAREMLNMALQYPESRSSLAMWKKNCLLMCASPIEEHRSKETGVKLAETILNSAKKKNIRDPETYEILGVAYANVGRYDDAIKAANMGLEMLQGGANEEMKKRIEHQIGLYKASKPFRLPTGGTTSMPAGTPGAKQ